MQLLEDYSANSPTRERLIMYISPLKSALGEYRELSEKWLDTLKHSLLPKQTGLDQSAYQSGDVRLSSRKANVRRPSYTLPLALDIYDLAET